MTEEASDASHSMLLNAPMISPLRPADERRFWTNNMAIFGTNVKEEPMDDTKNDSGVTSGSECPSTSPASDRSSSNPSTSPPQNNIYPFPAARGSRHQYNPWYPANAQIPSSSEFSTQGTQGQLIPSSDRSSVSPKTDIVADDNSNYFEDIRHPKVNSHGKVKVHKCKQCDFFAYTKLEYWEHSQVHIKGDKILKCPKCPFVTEYKHHLEYHLLNHAGEKPFKCPHCDYSCVNKSMLNSHLKSHSKVYQYRCSDCQYETKYCHSLKLHLRKYTHKPAMVLNPDGSPNPLPIIDVYGTRRGPKVKKVSGANSSLPSTSRIQQVDSQLPQIPFNPLMPLLNQNAMLPFPLPLIPGFPGLPTQEMMIGFQNMVRDHLDELAKQNAGQPEHQPEAQPEAPPELQHQPQENGALDLSNKSSHNSENGDSDEEEMRTAFENVEVVENNSAEAEGEPTREAEREPDNSPKGTNKYDFACQYCGICFGDEVMFRIHMGYHGYSNPFTCNMCGEECGNKVAFFLHIARAAH